MSPRIIIALLLISCAAEKDDQQNNEEGTKTNVQTRESMETTSPSESSGPETLPSNQPAPPETAGKGMTTKPTATDDKASKNHNLERKGALLSKLVGKYSLLSISGAVGANGMFDYLVEDGRWSASGSSISQGMREPYDIDLTANQLRQLESMRIVVKKDLSVDVVCDEKIFHSSPFNADGLDYSLSKPPADFILNVPKELTTKSTFIGDDLYLMARDSISYNELLRCNIADIDADSLVLRYNLKSKGFQLSMFYGDCCDSSTYFFK